MNDVMGMQKDKDIVSIELASVQEAEEYDFEEDHAPAQLTLGPMRPYLVKPRSTWNKKLWGLLAARIAKRHEFDDLTWKEMEKAFYECLQRLNSLLKTEKQALNTSAT
ncbi:hypothetical protein AX14_001875 [Amanita brunnescens Koide BX004]|jgi:hypothetical protein|nr:hypothetical protein AX14_001875 [Amanita brunnescens Koide BX004]